MGSDADLENLLVFIRDARGFGFTGYKRTSLARRIRKGASEVGISGYTDHRDRLESSAEEFGYLFNMILINVTSFFRDPEAWSYLQHEIMPELIADTDGKDEIRVVEVFVDLHRKSQRQEADATVPAPGPATMAGLPPGEAFSHRPGLTQIMADLQARLGNLEATILGLGGGLAASRCEPGAVVSEMSEQIRDLRMVADAPSARFADHAG